ncbi:glycosyltransferase family 2 protein [Methylobacterium radiodurans]|uniref:glycosyltransferase family 2 protein n=1 Tax=Methylobacterium radiodurans TaxID=2202828 RepID=UPI0019508C59|nr:glycosyltransferase family 2 protein [Methylobacterium radiodurans]
MTAHAALDVVIVNWNGGALVQACVASLARAAAALDLRVVVVDNASTDGSAEALEAFARIDHRASPSPAEGEGRFAVRVIRNGENLGFARACNIGAAAGSAKTILFLNPDTRADGPALLAARAALLADPGTGIVGARQIADDGTVERSCARAPTPASLLGQALALDRLGLVPPHFMTEWDHAEDRAVDQVMGAFLMIRRPLFERLGGFDERFFVYYEDVDLCRRARSAGWAVRHVAGAVIGHAGQGTTRQARAHRLFYILRARVQYAAKHHGRATALALLAASFLAEVPLRLARAAARRAPAEAAETLRGAGLLARVTPALLAGILRGR